MKPEIAKDLIELISQLDGIKKSKSVSYKETKFMYTPLEDILTKIKENKKWGLLQPLKTENGVSTIRNILVHESGETLESGEFELLINRSSRMQDVGSVITYTRRYSLASWLGVSSDEDNDGQIIGKLKPEKTDKATSEQTTTIIGLIGADVPHAKKICELFGVKKLSELTSEQARIQIETLSLK